MSSLVIVFLLLCVDSVGSKLTIDANDNYYHIATVAKLVQTSHSGGQTIPTLTTIHDDDDMSLFSFLCYMNSRKIDRLIWIRDLLHKLS